MLVEMLTLTETENTPPLGVTVGTATAGTVTVGAAPESAIDAPAPPEQAMEPLAGPPSVGLKRAVKIALCPAVRL